MKLSMSWLAMAGFIVAAGCDRTSTFHAPDGGTATVTEKGGGVEMTFKGPGGEIVRMSSGGQNVAIPDGFPSDVPMYPGASVVTSTKSAEGMNVSLRTGDTPAKIVGFYEEKLKAAGYSIEASVALPTGNMLTTKKASHTVSVATLQENGGTIVNLVVVVEK